MNSLYLCYAMVVKILQQKTAFRNIFDYLDFVALKNNRLKLFII